MSELLSGEMTRMYKRHNTFEMYMRKMVSTPIFSSIYNILFSHNKINKNTAVRAIFKQRFLKSYKNVQINKKCKQKAFRKLQDTSQKCTL